MKPGSWKQWLRLTKKQLRQFGRTLDQELGHVLNRTLPNQAGKMIKIPIPIRPTPNKITMKSVICRNFHQLVKNSTRKVPGIELGHSSRSRLIGQGHQSVSLFAMGSKVPKNMPRGLYTNWNMANSRFSSQRMYSTASIKFTHEAANNIGISLRCLLSSLEDTIPQKQEGEQRHIKVNTQQNLGSRLSLKSLSIIRDLEVFEMIQDHRKQCNILGEEAIGSFVEFNIPTLKMEDIPMAFVNDHLLNEFEQNVSVTNKQMELLQESLRTIYDSYGSLPIAYDQRKNSIRIHFPNSTMGETEALITDLGCSLGFVYPESTHAYTKQRFRSDEENESVLSNINLGSTNGSVDGDFMYPSVISSSETESFSVI